MTTPQAGTRRFGKYRLLKKIGSGGMAEVYKAGHARDQGSPVAIKRILTDLSRDKKLVAMLINEAKLAMMLNHPNIVPIYDFGLVDRHYFLAMEYVDGKDLRAFLKKAYSEDRIMPLEISVQIMVSILEGLAYAHSKRDNFNKPLEIIHRDVSPQNIMISYDGQVKILDFGIAKAKGSLTETQAGILKGKFSYMSPEQAKGKEIDQRSDIFAAGIVFHELLTTRSLFGDQSEIRTIQNVRKAKVPNPAKLNRKVPQSLSKIVTKALSKWRFRRYSTAEEFRDELLDWANENQISFSREALVDYIDREFPRGAKDDFSATIPEADGLAGKEALTVEFSPDSASNIGNLIEEELGKEPPAEGLFRDTVIETSSPLQSFPPSFPTYKSPPRKSTGIEIFTARRVFYLLIAGIAVFIFMKRDRIKLDRATLERLYDIVVIRPAEKLKKHRSQPSPPGQTGLAFDPAAVFKTDPQILLSSKAREYLYSISLPRFDKIMKGIKGIAVGGGTPSLKECRAASDRLSCVEVEETRLFYAKEGPEGNIRIELAQPAR